MSMEHLRFLLYEVHNINEDVLQLERYADYDIESVNLLLDSAKSWADQEFYPYFKEMDEQPAHYKDGKVITHPQLNYILKQAGENGWLGTYFDYEDGGLQMPFVVNSAFNHILESANNHVPGYLGLTSGAAHLIVSFGNEELKNTYIPNMLSGKWSGTMCLTEPQAGSSLSDVKTAAFPTEHGYYKIKGQKIFISGGDHLASENFVHLTLARIEGAPAGTKGISLFVIPKYRPKPDGTFEYNDVLTAGDFQKLGQRGYSTVHLVFGEEDNCYGWLVGEPNQGLKYMFQMMNGARLAVGVSATSTATAAYYASLQYAKERPQGRRIESSGRKNPDKEQTLIINHADVRRMLLLQKAIVEGALSLLIECSKYVDLASYAADEESRSKYHLLLELLTPIAKTYPAEKGKEAIDNGLQVLGGYGFCMDFPLQQYYRDVRIMSIYEGTTGIQSLDLLGRKVTLENGKALQLLMAQMLETINKANDYADLKPYASTLQERINDVQRALTKLIPYAISGEYELFLADATIFMQLISTVIIGYHWLKMAVKAKQAILSGNGQFDYSFYESKILTMKIYYKYELPKATAYLETLLSNDVLTIVEEKEEILN